MREKKNLLIYAHYYSPDIASTGQILKELAEGMLELFHITVICVAPSYGGVVETRYKSRRFYQENINGVLPPEVHSGGYETYQGQGCNCDYL